MPLEKEIVKKIRTHLKSTYDAEVFKHHGGPFSEIGVADLIGALPPHGRMLAIECKQVGRKATPAQAAWLLRYAKAGAITGVADSIESVDNILAPFL